MSETYIKVAGCFYKNEKQLPLLDFIVFCIWFYLLAYHKFSLSYLSGVKPSSWLLFVFYRSIIIVPQMQIGRTQCPAATTVQSDFII